jgi:hypothetical protein
MRNAPEIVEVDSTQLDEVLGRVEQKLCPCGKDAKVGAPVIAVPGWSSMAVGAGGAAWMLRLGSGAGFSDLRLSFAATEGARGR